jgi:hypothetical protein
MEVEYLCVLMAIFTISLTLYECMYASEAENREEKCRKLD